MVVPVSTTAMLEVTYSPITIIKNPNAMIPAKIKLAVLAQWFVTAASWPLAESSSGIGTAEGSATIPWVGVDGSM
jgi:hypothetical protein